MKYQYEKTRKKEEQILYETSLRLCKLRELCGLTQEEVAQELNMSRMLYSRIEAGKINIPTLYVDKLAKAFDNKVFKIGEPGLFDYNIKLYSNYMVLIYMTLFAVPEKDVQKAFGLDRRQLGVFLNRGSRAYLPQYKEEIDELFPQKDLYDSWETFHEIGENSFEGEINGRKVLLLNCKGRLVRDSILNLPGYEPKTTIIENA